VALVTKRLPTGIDRLPSGKYRVRVSLGKLPTGRWKYGGGTFTRLKDATARRQDIIVAKQTGRVEQLDADLITLAEAATAYMATERAHLAEATFTTYRNLWRAHVTGPPRHPIADMSLRAITPATVEGFRDDRLAAGAGPESIRKTLVVMQSVLKRAVRDERLSRNPVAAVRKPAAARREHIVPTTPEAVERLRAKLDGADAVLVSLIAYGGLRPGEARGLQWSDVTDRNLHVRRAVGPEGVKATKTTKTRTVPLASALRADLGAWRRAVDPAAADFILSRADGAPWTTDDYRNWQRRRLRTAVKASGVALARPYDLRHSAASLWIAEGRNPVEVASWLGHDPTMTLRTYAHVVADRDPSDHRTFDDRVMAARRDTSVTYERVKVGQAGVKRKSRKRRKQPVSAAPA
jgi:integrase